MTDNPRDFFEKMVRPPYQAWMDDPLSEWKATAVVSNADTMAERVFVYWSRTDQTKIGGALTVSLYRRHLKQDVCPDFGLVRDVHDGHKHMILDRPDRQITTSGQTGPARMGWGEGGYGEGMYGGGDQIVIHLDNGSKRALSAVMKNVMEMWAHLLTSMGL